MSSIQAIMLGGLQGLTELFPISSLGHSVLLPHILGWNINEKENSFLIFLVATHLATSLVLFGFYWKDWMAIVKGIIHSLKEREISESNSYGRIGWLLIVATVPAGILGLLFEEKFKALFASPIPVSIFLLLNGVMLLGMEAFRKRQVVNGNKTSLLHPEKLSWRQAVNIGIAQCLSLLPGFSRTGATLGGGLLAGLDHADAAHFSFLLATPIIFAASVLKIPELLTGGNTPALHTILLGAFCSAIAAYFSVRFLSRYFKTKSLTPFGIYCVIAGSLSLLYFVL